MRRALTSCEGSAAGLCCCCFMRFVSCLNAPLPNLDGKRKKENNSTVGGNQYRTILFYFIRRRRVQAGAFNTGREMLVNKWMKSNVVCALGRPTYQAFKSLFSDRGVERFQFATMQQCITATDTHTHRSITTKVHPYR